MRRRTDRLDAPAKLANAMHPHVQLPDEYADVGIGIGRPSCAAKSANPTVCTRPIRGCDQDNCRTIDTGRGRTGHLGTRHIGTGCLAYFRRPVRDAKPKGPINN